MTVSKYPALLCLALILSSFSSDVATAQNEAPKHEFRAAWIAAVTNLDWPLAGVTDPAVQQEHLIEILDELSELGINAVIFHVRPEADALYDSELEPWSYWLTGEQGKAPEPYYDPLAMAIEESHKRGMELHAWFNPYRVEQVIGRYERDESHVSVENPDWTFSFEGTRVLDPGLPQVREYVTEVIMDVVRRYDVDGIHFDDYFYPYPVDGRVITNEDDETFAEHNRGITNRGAWRRDNVNLLMEMVNDSINAVKPHIKFGVSPFGIWKNGVPSGIIGLDAYNTIYADAVAWLDAESVDYIAPQLYWPFGGAQDYARLADWWGSVRNGRHLYPGLAAYKSDAGSFWNPGPFPADAVPRQVRFNRDSEEIQGGIIFRSSNLTRYPSKGLADSLRQNVFTTPALTPPMEWKNMMEPSAPMEPAYQWMTDDTTIVEISWQEGEVSDGAAETRRYAVYRVYADEAPNLSEVMANGENLIAVTGETSIVDRPSSTMTHYYITSVSANSIESTADVVVSLEGRFTSADVDRPSTFELLQNYPNPFSGSTTIGFSVREAGDVMLRIYDMMGREIATVHEGFVPAGSHSVRFEAQNLASGTYLYVLDTAEGRQAQTLTLLR